MSRDRSQQPQKLNPGDLLDRTLIRHGLAELVPRSRRGHAPFPLKLVLVLLALVGLLGLPYGGVLLCLISAFAVEAASWAFTFVQPFTHTPQPEAALRLEPVSGRFWIWSGEQLLDLTSLEEAQWYGRFAAR